MLELIFLFAMMAIFVVAMVACISYGHYWE